MDNTEKKYKYKGWIVPWSFISDEKGRLYWVVGFRPYLEKDCNGVASVYIEERSDGLHIWRKKAMEAGYSFLNKGPLWGTIPVMVIHEGDGE